MIIRQFRIPVVLLIVTDWKCPIFSSYWWPTFLHGFFDPFLDWYSGVTVLDSWGKNPVISKELSDKILALKSARTSCSKRKSGWGPVVVIWVSCCCTTFIPVTWSCILCLKENEIPFVWKIPKIVCLFWELCFRAIEMSKNRPLLMIKSTVLSYSSMPFPLFWRAANFCQWSFNLSEAENLRTECCGIIYAEKETLEVKRDKEKDADRVG